MTKEAVIKAREASSTAPIKVTCDNMIIIWDRANDPNNPVGIVIWDDDNEQIITVRPGTEDIQEVYPFEITYTEYEHIQFIETFMTPKDVMKWFNEYKSKMDENGQKQFETMVQRAVSRRGYTGTLPTPNVMK